MSASLLSADSALQESVRNGRALFVELRTPEGSIYTGGASSVLVPGAKGAMGVLPRHAPLLSSLEVGFCRIRDPLGKEWAFVTALGFVEIQNNEVLILVDSAEIVDEIDVSRAEAAKERAKVRLRTPSEEVDAARAEAALQRALIRLRFVPRV
jgi:F-type H+-transporting ATPase subunit epsilon